MSELDVQLVNATRASDLPLPVPQSEVSPPVDPTTVDPAPMPVNDRLFPSVPVHGGMKTEKEQRWIEKTKAPTLWEKWQSKSWVMLVAIWVVAMVFLYLLNPPLICKTNARDDLDAYQCSYWRLAAWGAVAPLVYLLLPLVGLE